MQLDAVMLYNYLNKVLGLGVEVLELGRKSSDINKRLGSHFDEKGVLTTARRREENRVFIY